MILKLENFILKHYFINVG